MQQSIAAAVPLKKKYHGRLIGVAFSRERQEKVVRGRLGPWATSRKRREGRTQGLEGAREGKNHIEWTGKRPVSLDQLPGPITYTVHGVKSLL